MTILANRLPTIRMGINDGFLAPYRVLAVLIGQEQ